ncbi:ORC1-type DNA replication protein [[Eubacterium] cellulosolvens]
MTGSMVNFIRDELSKPSLFKDESPLSLEYVPPRLPHRDQHLRFLTQLFRFQLENPGSMSQRVLITGDVGTGKTVLATYFGAELEREAKLRKINLKYAHVNCRESRGSLFLVLKKVLLDLLPRFPQRGFSTEELLRMLMEVLEDRKIFMILTLDELESLIRIEGSAALYNLTRIQEQTATMPRLSLICIFREARQLQKLDRSTLGTLQQNLIQLERYSSLQLLTILQERTQLALKEGTISEENLQFIADTAAKTGDARYAIELLWRSGKYADSEEAREIAAEHIRKAIGSIDVSFDDNCLLGLSLSEKLVLLAIARLLKSSAHPYVTMGDIESTYHVICEEYGEETRKHTQLWKYIQNLTAIGILTSQKSSNGQKGRTTLVALASTPADATARWLESSLEPLKKLTWRKLSRDKI